MPCDFYQVSIKLILKIISNEIRIPEFNPNCEKFLTVKSRIIMVIYSNFFT